ncbi:MAG: zf-HC2 domain-containing protein [Actinobacteria bacterium]|nr:zf-HC2 domain-containing protein [Actinomycetota bacterium]
MADCNETLRELETFLDSELPDETRAAIQAHLGDCVDCLQAFDFYAELRVVISEKCRNEEIPPGLIARIELCFNEDFDGDSKIG